MANNIDIKTSLKRVYALFDELEKLADNPKNLKKRYRDIFRAEFMIYVLYLINPTTFSDVLVAFLNDLFDLKFTGENYRGIITELNLEKGHLDIGDYKSTYLLTAFKDYVGEVARDAGESGIFIQNELFCFYISTGKYIMTSPFGATRKESIQEIIAEIENNYLHDGSNIKTTNNDRAISLNKINIKRNTINIVAENKTTNTKGTYRWSKFYPNHCDDETLDEMIKENVTIICDKDISTDDFIEALGWVYEEKNQKKIIDDLLGCGFKISEALIYKYYDSAGENEILEYLMNNYEGSYSKKTLKEFLENWLDANTKEKLIKSFNDSLTFGDIVEFVKNNTFEDAELKALISKTIGEPTREQLVDILDEISWGQHSLMKKYVDKLPFEERMDLKDEYNF